MQSPALSTSFATAARRLLPVLGGVILSFPLAGRAAAQQQFANLPVIEPRLTRIIGGDTLRINDTALSPDGRWVAFSQRNATGTEASLWIVSAEGGEPRRLVDTADVGEPVWFPGGDRLAYFAYEISAIMSVPFDTRTGQVSGRPQRVTISPAARYFRLSPDGKWFAYRVWADDQASAMQINVIPSNGGNARTLGAREEMLALMDWSADGRYIYYGSSGRIFRAPVDGGPSEPVTQPPVGAAAPQVPYFVFSLPGDPAAGPPFVVVGFDGRPVARIALPQGSVMSQAGRTFAAGETLMLTVVSNTVRPVRLLPVAGGASRQLGDARASEMPLGWSPDGSRVFFSTQLDGRTSIMSAPVAGGAATELGPMPDRGPPERMEWANPITFSPDARYLSYSRPTPGSTERTFVIRPVAGGEERVVTTALHIHDASRLSGPGGTRNLAGNEFLYLERKGDRAELRATSPEGPARLLRSLALTDVGRGLPVAVFEDRVAYTRYPEPVNGARPAGSTTRLVVARGVDGVPREVAAVPGVEAFDDIAWSPDGRWLAGIAYVGDPPDDMKIRILVVGVTPEGQVSTPARLIDTPIIYAAWSLLWLADGSAVTLTGQSPPDGRYDVWLVPVRTEGRAQALTRDDPNGLGYNVLSPDGRFIAYRSYIERGSSLWLADLGDALKKLR